MAVFARLQEISRNMMKTDICLITFPSGLAAHRPISNLLATLSAVANTLYLISGGQALNTLTAYPNVRIMKVEHEVSSYIIVRIFNYLHTQLRIVRKMLTL